MAPEVSGEVGGGEEHELVAEAALVVHHPHQLPPRAAVLLRVAAEGGGVVAGEVRPQPGHQHSLVADVAEHLHLLQRIVAQGERRLLNRSLLGGCLRLLLGLLLGLGLGAEALLDLGPGGVEGQLDEFCLAHFDFDFFE